ncbi:hypothetical protein [Hafnia phage yong3]|nr:hypothetical protein [Hafnia phage yong3]
MEYLLALIGIVLIAIVVIACDKRERGLTGMARVLLRVLAVALFATGFGVAFQIIEMPTKYYGFVKLQHQLTYATIFELGAVTLAMLSFASKR